MRCSKYLYPKRKMHCSYIIRNVPKVQQCKNILITGTSWFLGWDKNGHFWLVDSVQIKKIHLFNPEIYVNFPDLHKSSLLGAVYTQDTWLYHPLLSDLIKAMFIISAISSNTWRSNGSRGHRDCKQAHVPWGDVSSPCESLLTNQRKGHRHKMSTGIGVILPTCVLV